MLKNKNLVNIERDMTLFLRRITLKEQHNSFWISLRHSCWDLETLKILKLYLCRGYIYKVRCHAKYLLLKYVWEKNYFSFSKNNFNKQIIFPGNLHFIELLCQILNRLLWFFLPQNTGTLLSYVRWLSHFKHKVDCLDLYSIKHIRQCVINRYIF